MRPFAPSCWLACALMIWLSVAYAGAAELPATRPATVRAAAIQFTSKWGRPEENRAGLEPLIREAARNGAKLIVLPEAAITAYMSQDIRLTWQVGRNRLTDGLTGVSPQGAAETVPGPSTEQFGKLAAELGVYLTVPIVEVSGGTYYNTLILMDPAGKIALHYRKLNPWPWAERGWATKGDRGHQVIDTPYGRLGLLICYDINFEPPALKKLQVDHLLYAIAWVDEKGSDWFTRRLPQIARNADINIIGANWAVPDTAGWYGYGQSRIILRTGQIAATAISDYDNEIIYADLPIPEKH